MVIKMVVLPQTYIDVIHKWAIKWDTCSRDNLLQYITNMKITSLDQYTSKFLSTLTTYTETLSDEYKDIMMTEDNIISGLSCLYFSMLLSYINCGHIKNADTLINFSTIYIVLDCILDNPSISSNMKYNICKILSTAVDNVAVNNVTLDINEYSKYYNLDELPSDVKSLCIILIDIIHKIHTKIPSSYPYLKKLYYAELESYKLQHIDGLDIDIYKKMASLKGGSTVEAIQSLLELPVTQDEYNLGAVIQLIDDIYDVKDDMNNNIITNTTLELSTHNNINSILMDGIRMIEAIPSNYSCIKLLLMNMLMYSVGTSGKDSFTHDIILQLDDYTPVKYGISIRSIIYKRLGDWL